MSVTALILSDAQLASVKAGQAARRSMLQAINRTLVARRTMHTVAGQDDDHVAKLEAIMAENDAEMEAIDQVIESIKEHEDADNN
jgi:hypothetical protein